MAVPKYLYPGSFEKDSREQSGASETWRILFSLTISRVDRVKVSSVGYRAGTRGLAVDKA